MLTLRRSNPVARTLGAFLGSVFVVFSVLLVLGVGVALPSGTLKGSVVASCLFLGLAWVVLGWVFTPSVSAYIGPGAIEGVPILWPGSAIPERSEPVLRDLSTKLSRGTDLGITLAVLGFLLMSLGVVYYLSPPIGIVTLAVYLSAVAALELYVLRLARAAPAG